jgi:hypothetical protein
VLVYHVLFLCHLVFLYLDPYLYHVFDTLDVEKLHGELQQVKIELHHRTHSLDVPFPHQVKVMAS